MALAPNLATLVAVGNGHLLEHIFPYWRCITRGGINAVTVSKPDAGESAARTATRNDVKSTSSILAVPDRKTR